MYNNLIKLENEAIELQNKINRSNDYFFIFGWIKQLEEVKKRIEELKPLFRCKIDFGYQVTYENKPIQITYFEILKDKTLFIGNNEFSFELIDLADYASDPNEYLGFQAVCRFFRDIQNGLTEEQKLLIDQIYYTELTDYDLESFF